MQPEPEPEPEPQPEPDLEPDPEPLAQTEPETDPEPLAPPAPSEPAQVPAPAQTEPQTQAQNSIPEPNEETRHKVQKESNAMREKLTKEDCTKPFVHKESDEFIEYIDNKRRLLAWKQEAWNDAAYAARSKSSEQMKHLPDYVAGPYSNPRGLLTSNQSARLRKLMWMELCIDKTLEAASAIVQFVSCREGSDKCEIQKDDGEEARKEGEEDEEGEEEDEQDLSCVERDVLRFTKEGFQDLDNVSIRMHQLYRTMTVTDSFGNIRSETDWDENSSVFPFNPMAKREQLPSTHTQIQDFVCHRVGHVLKSNTVAACQYRAALAALLYKENGTEEDGYWEDDISLWDVVAHPLLRSMWTDLFSEKPMSYEEYYNKYVLPSLENENKRGEDGSNIRLTNRDLLNDQRFLDFYNTMPIRGDMEGESILSKSSSLFQLHYGYELPLEDFR